MSLVWSALYAKCPYYGVLYMQSVLIMECFICKMSTQQSPTILAPQQQRATIFLEYTIVIHVRADMQWPCRSGERRMQGAKARHPQRRLAEQGPQECINTDDPEEKFRLKMPVSAPPTAHTSIYWPENIYLVRVPGSWYEVVESWLK